MQVWRFMLTNAQRARSAMIALTTGIAFMMFYQKLPGKAYTSILRS